MHTTVDQKIHLYIVFGIVITFKISFPITKIKFLQELCVVHFSNTL
jgi:hypothetical protein